MAKTRIISALVAVCISAGMALQAQEMITKEGRNIRVKVGSSYWITSGVFKINANETLPIVVGIRNMNAPRKLSVKISPSDIQEYPPIAHGFEVIEKNPSAPITMDDGECKMLHFNIKINSNGHQWMKVEVVDDKGFLWHMMYLVVNDPLYKNMKYAPFNESMLCDFSLPPGAL